MYDFSIKSINYCIWIGGKIIFKVIFQPEFTCSKLTIETLKPDVTYVQS